MLLHNNVLSGPLALSLAVLLAACGDDKGDTATDSTTASTTASTAGTTGETISTAATSEPTTEPTTEPATTEPATTEPTTEPTSGSSTGADSSTGDDTTTGLTGPSWAADVWPVLNPPALCDCHTPGSGGLLMGDVDTAYTNLVGVMSTESPLTRIEPGSVDASYLWHKINGTQNDVGGSGSNMPLGAPPLPQATLDLIQEWIDGGAQP